MNQKIKQMLIRLAIENPGTKGRYKLAAGIVYKKHLIATGLNSYKTHPLMKSPGYREEQIYIHAEVDAIKNSLRLITQEELSRASLYVVRVKKNVNGDYIEGLARPCEGCSKMIASFGITDVKFTTNELGETNAT